MSKKTIIGIFAGILIAAIAALSSNVVEHVDAGEIVVIQDAIDGGLHVYSTPGYAPQWFGTPTHYKKSFQFWFTKKKEGEGPNESIKIRFNDGGHAEVSGSARINLPIDEKSVVKFHTDFRSQEAIEAQIIRTTIEKSIYMTGPLMSSKESYAEKRNDLLSFIEDQASTGVYRTKSTEHKVKDELSGVEKTVTVVEPIMENSIIKRQEISPLKIYNIQLNTLSLNSIDYDATVEAQIQKQQESTMNISIAIANAKKSEQDAITVEQQGKAEAAKAKWTQEAIKSQAVTLGEQTLAVQELATKQALLYKQQQILEGEGEAEKQKLIMSANGALEMKLATYERVSKMYADALQNYKGAWVPSIVMGGDGKAGGSAADFMNMFTAKAAKDLSLDMGIKK